MPGATLTIGTTATKPVDMLTGKIGGASKTYSGLAFPNGVQRLLIQNHPDNTDRIYFGDADVSASNCFLLLDPGQTLSKESAHGMNDIPFGFFIKAAAAAQLVNVWVEYA